ncbi:MAG: metalloregulator ArsR/SmtB family transcription factor [Chloroflexota bacterium]
MDFFKALADNNRLRIVGILAERERSLEELATLLALKPPVVTHHLVRLQVASLLRTRAEGSKRVYVLDSERLQALRREVLRADKVSAPADTADGTAWERKVLRDFFDSDRLKGIPTTASKRDVILRRLAAHFVPGTRYRERDVNDILLRHYADSNALRRLLIDAHLLQRTPDGSAYWRVTEVGEATVIHVAGAETAQQ